MADKHHFPPLISWFSDKMQEIPSPKSVLKVGNKPPKAALFVVHTFFFFFFLKPDMTISFGYA